jgi:hypothetical protein
VTGFDSSSLIESVGHALQESRNQPVLRSITRIEHCVENLGFARAAAGHRVRELVVFVNSERHESVSITREDFGNEYVFGITYF